MNPGVINNDLYQRYQRKGKNHISTNNLFATLRRLNPEPLSNFFKKLPTDALPEPISEDISVDVIAHRNKESVLTT